MDDNSTASAVKDMALAIYTNAVVLWFSETNENLFSTPCVFSAQPLYAIFFHFEFRGKI